jgi:hypothetical protein
VELDVLTQAASSDPVGPEPTVAPVPVPEQRTNACEPTGSALPQGAVVDQINLAFAPQSLVTLGLDRAIDQTFTVGATGLLAGIDIGVYREGTPTGKVLALELHRCPGPVGDNPALGVPYVRASQVPSAAALSPGRPGPTYFDLSPCALFVQTGDVLSFELGPDASLRVLATSGDQYRAGGITGASGDDLAFVTYVVPE